MTQYFLGADVGATKTEVCIADEFGHLLAVGRSGPGNHETVGYEGLTHALSSAAQEAFDRLGLTHRNIAGVGFGVAGYDWPCERQMTLDSIDKAGFTIPRIVVNDTEIGLVAGTSQSWGIALVSGTGCNCWGWNKDYTKVGRVVGRSTLAGEAAGSTEFVEEAMRFVTWEWTKRSSHTAISDALINHFGVKDLTELLEGYYNERLKIDGSFAPEIFRIAEEGDTTARQIVLWASEELAEMVKAVIRQLSFEHISFEIVLIGGMFKAGEMLIKPLREAILQAAPQASFHLLSVPPAIGGVILGMKAAGFTTTPEIRENLKKRIE